MSILRNSCTPCRQIPLWKTELNFLSLWFSSDVLENVGLKWSFLLCNIISRLLGWAESGYFAVGLYIWVCVQDCCAAFLASSSPESHWSRNIQRLSQQDQDETQHTVFFFPTPPVSLVNLVLCLVSFPLNSCFLLFMQLASPYLSISHTASPSLFLPSSAAWATTGHLGTACAIQLNPPPPPSSLPADAAFFLK